MRNYFEMNMYIVNLTILIAGGCTG